MYSGKLNQQSKHNYEISPIHIFKDINIYIHVYKSVSAMGVLIFESRTKAQIALLVCLILHPYR